MINPVEVPSPALMPGWYAIASQRQVQPGQRRRVHLATYPPMVLWRSRDTRTLYALEDRCPHRQVPLSAGRVVANTIVCPYHGWRFNGDGDCVHIPAEAPQTASATPAYQRCVATFPVRETLGLIWLGHAPGEREPYDHPTLLASDRTVVQTERAVDAHVADVVENFIDSAHTPHLHRGIIRSGNAVGRDVEVTCEATRVSAHHAPVRESVGLFSRWVNPRHELLTHSDVVYAPGVVEVTYRYGERAPVFIAVIACTPLSATRTHIFVTLSLRLGKIGGLIKPLLSALAAVVLKQDMAMLRLQRSNLARLTRRHDFFPQSDTFHRRVRRLMRGQPMIAKTERFTMHV